MLAVGLAQILRRFFSYEQIPLCIIFIFKQIPLCIFKQLKSFSPLTFGLAGFRRGKK
jgi:hypothetical protein